MMMMRATDGCWYYRPLTMSADKGRSDSISTVKTSAETAVLTSASFAGRRRDNPIGRICLSQSQSRARSSGGGEGTPPERQQTRKEEHVGSILQNELRRKKNGVVCRKGHAETEVEGRTFRTGTFGCKWKRQAEDRTLRQGYCDIRRFHGQRLPLRTPALGCRRGGWQSVVQGCCSKGRRAKCRSHSAGRCVVLLVLDVIELPSFRRRLIFMLTYGMSRDNVASFFQENAFILACAL